MKILITGGSTEVQIDKVRVISNIFRGRTAADVTLKALRRAQAVTLVGNPGMKSFLPKEWLELVRFVPYRTFDELMSVMEVEIKTGKYDCVIHSAAVSDYSVSRVLGPEMEPLNSSGKVSSSHQKLYLEMIQTPKIVDRIRKPWGFRGTLVKFKLQVGMSDEELLTVARSSMEHSGADLIVANCLEWARDRAYVIGRQSGGEGLVQSVSRDELSNAILDAIDDLGP